MTIKCDLFPCLRCLRQGSIFDVYTTVSGIPICSLCYSSLLCSNISPGPRCLLRILYWELCDSIHPVHHGCLFAACDTLWCPLKCAVPPSPFAPDVTAQS